jgi:hypothetical protein
MDQAHSSLYARFGREAFATLAGNFELRVFRFISVLCHTASVIMGCSCGIEFAARAASKNADGQGTTRDCYTI